MYSWYVLRKLAQTRATELAHIAEQEHMYERLMATASKSQRRVARRHAFVRRLTTVFHLGPAGKQPVGQRSADGRGPLGEPIDA
jgi:hypothetical protein